MSEQSTEAAQTTPANQEQQAADTSQADSGEQEAKTFDAEYVGNLRKEAAKYRTEAKNAAAELEKQRQASMSEADKAVAEAETRGRSAATEEFGKELAQTQFDALAGRRNPEFDTAKALKRLDLKSLLGEDGRPDLKEIQAAVDDLVPAPADGPPSFDGGTRTSPPAQQGMSGLIRKAAGRA